MKEVFPIVPASNAPIWFFFGLAIILMGLLGFFGYIVYSSRHVRVELTDQQIRIRGDIYGRSLALQDLVREQAEVVDLATRTELQMKWRKNGVGLPGYQSGWFKLRNGDKALVFVTDRRQVVVIPTRNGYTLLLSVADPQEFVARLQQTL